MGIRKQESRKGRDTPACTNPDWRRHKGARGLITNEEEGTRNPPTGKGKAEGNDHTMAQGHFTLKLSFPGGSRDRRRVT